jgi:hypothetical protein
MHFRLKELCEWQFFWEDGEPVGSDMEEAAKYLRLKNQAEVNRHLGDDI